MGTINFTAITDGSTADATDVNTPLQTIYDEFNGNISNANIASAAAIAGSKLADGSVTPAKLATGAASSTLVTTTETTTSTSYTNLATTTDTVTVTIGANGLALVIVYCGLFYNNTGTTGYSYVSFAGSGANTIAAADTNALVILATGANVPQVGFGSSVLLTGLTAGSTTFKMKYRVAAGTGGFANRKISVIPL